MTDTPDLIVSEDVTRKLYDALFRLEAWSVPFIQSGTGISAETLWREFPAAVRNADDVLRLARKDTEGGAS